MAESWFNLVYCSENTDACYTELKKMFKRYDIVILVATKDIDMNKLLKELEKEFKNLIIEDIASGKELGVDYIIKLRRV
ncbi:MAG: hypothetical protein DRJ40_08350 [Thermoprotei archaeon]|nr:MAG: hypothetical protein DRJ40_08350 [Thermoprotei archaeon]